MFFQGKEIMVYPASIDMRKSFDGLFKLVRQEGIFENRVFLFMSKNRKRAKLIWWDGSGLLILMKRMEFGRFADVFSRETLSHQEISEFYTGSKIISRSSYVKDKEQKASVLTCPIF